MPKLKPGQRPKYRHHKPSGRAVVTLDGKDEYLGPYDSEESRSAYYRLTDAWLARKSVIKPDHSVRSEPAVISDVRLVGELVLKFDEWAQRHYFSNGEVGRECTNIQHALRPLVSLYGNRPVDDLNFNAFERVRESMVREGLTRKVVNDRMRRIRMVMRWASAREMVSPKVVSACDGVKALRPGRLGVKEGKGVQPVAERDVVAALKRLPPTVQAMVRLHWHTGMRPGEVVIMRGIDIDMSNDVWVYRPYKHKTSHLGQAREVYIGEKAQRVIRPYLSLDTHAFLFSPRVAMEERWGTEARGEPARQRRKIRDRYTTQSYGRAVRYACERSGIDIWSPNQLRHNAATRFRRLYGIDIARSLLGHSSLDTTMIYAEVDSKKLVEVVRKTG